ncbi:MAG: rane protein [Labilithrix sp.]|nr:rane protein [Labilithrix sp.]
MIGVELVYRLAGIVVAIVALLNARDGTNPKRWQNTVFWGAYAISLLFGSQLPDVANGVLVIVLVLVAGLGGLGRGEPQSTSLEERVASAARWGNRLFFPALLVPTCTLITTLALRRVQVGGVPLVDPKNVSLIALALAAMIAVTVAVTTLRQPAFSPAREARRLMDLVGWAAVLPQMLAALGALFAAAGVGDRVAELLGRVVPLDNPFAVVGAYTLGMALFTVIMGNAFAAFPVMTAAVGIPLIVRRFGGDPAVMAALGMLSGFCGTLMTPMAANFNVVPAALLELPDRNGVIRVQLPTALLLLLGNTLLMYFLAFRR